MEIAIPLQHGFAQFCDQFARQLFGIRRIHPLRYQKKLPSGKSRRKDCTLRCRSKLRNFLADFCNHGIAHIAPVQVVDLFEVTNADKKQCSTARSRRFERRKP